MTRIQEPQLRGVRTWLNTRPDLLLAIAKRHTSNPLLSPPPLPSASSSSRTTTFPTLQISVPEGSPTGDTLRVKVETKARNVEVDIPLPSIPSGQDRRLPISAVASRRTIKNMGEEALIYFNVPKNPTITTYHPPLPKRCVVIFPIILLAYLTAAPKTDFMAETGRGLVEKYLGRWMIPIALWILSLSHFVIEPIWLLSKLRRHNVPFIPGLLYMLVVVMIGYGGIEALDLAVIEERVRLLHSKSTESKKAQ
ncbi:hypothetical protein CI109_100773 [Kwoniella shandongensis]|uniref:Uncharacterized protein n=1 Tax=Kwoniella shandongensis TaxID=1734106 RepID=A0A5M6BUW9_9TREE|nr:uncharacterized protein CI109_005048 [Kwoniella shandongensis]KAA5526658.1 hypothetical protein CI109_005048 [Kwoniella shandongensis]